MGSRSKGDTRRRPQPICRPRQSPSSPIAIAGPGQGHSPYLSLLCWLQVVSTEVQNFSFLIAQKHTSKEIHSYSLSIHSTLSPHTCIHTHHTHTHTHMNTNTHTHTHEHTL